MNLTTGVLLIIAGFTIGCDSAKWRPETRNFDPPISHANRLETGRLENLTAAFLKGYRKVTSDQRVPEAIRHYLEFSDTNVAANVILSESFESVIQLSAAPQNAVTFSTTHVPIQLLLFYRETAFIRPFPSNSLSLYIQSTSAFTVTNSRSIYIHNVRVIYAAHRPFNVHEGQLIAFRNIVFVRPAGDKDITNTVAPLSLLTGSTNFGRVTRDDMEQLGRFIGFKDILHALEEIPFFRQAYAHEQLRPDVEAYVLLRKKREEDLDFQRANPLYVLQEAYARLMQKAETWGVKDEYVKQWLDDLAKSSPTGRLLWYYQSFAGFMWNLTALALVSLIVGAFITGSQLARRISAPIVATAIFGWGFASRPPFTPIRYIILPGCLYLVVAAVTVFPNAWKSLWIRKRSKERSPSI